MKRPSKDAPFIAHILAQAHVDSKAVKMAIYGFLVSAPLGHVLVGALQRAFAGRTGTRARIAQILASNLLIAPIQTSGMPHRRLSIMILSVQGLYHLLSIFGVHGCDQWCEVAG